MKNRISRGIFSVVMIAMIGLGTTQRVAAQTYIKSNALYLLALVPNVSVETRLGEHTTFNGDVVGSLWQSINGRPYMVGQLIGEVRYYPKEANRGFYAGGYVGGHTFKLCKWDHPATQYQTGNGFSLGITLGYELPIAKRWLMDFYVGGGWQVSRYHGFDKLTDSYYALWNGSGEWLPYKAGVSFAYRLGKK